jgi:hypothetical protein
VTGQELAPLIAKLRQMVAHARTHGCFDGGVRDEITEAADKLEALSGRVSTMTKLLKNARDAIASLDVDALGWVEEPEARWPVREEMLHHIDAALAQTQSEG